MIVCKETFQQLAEYRKFVTIAELKVKEYREAGQDISEEFWQKEVDYWQSCYDNLIAVVRNGGYN